MSNEDQYTRNKPKLLNDVSICKANRELFKKFFDEEEYKLKRKNGLRSLDESCYKTLCTYIPRLRNVNRWFANKPWNTLSESKIKSVYDDLEDGKLTGSKGNVIVSKTDYYNKVFKSLPFELAGKSETAKRVMKYHYSSKSTSVRFFDEETFQSIAQATDTIKQRLLCWLQWDFGENIFTALRFQKRDFVQQIDPDTGETEFRVIFNKSKLKRSRKERSEITNFKETVELLEIVLSSLGDNDYLFNFGHRQALKFLNKATKKCKAKCISTGDRPTWKDFRSSMACHLLNTGWTTDEIKARLGHSPSSRALDKYVSYFAIDRHRPKKKVSAGKISRLVEQVEEMKQRERINLKRFDAQNTELSEVKSKLQELTSGGGILRMLQNSIAKERGHSSAHFGALDEKFDIVLKKMNSKKSS